MMKVIVEALRQDYNLFLGRDAFEGLDKLKAHDGLINLILADVMMPGMSGFDFCKQVMENEHWKSIPLIFVTALMGEADQLKGYSIGATDYITKPYNIKILKEKVDHWISRRQYEAILENMSRELELKVEQVSKVKEIVLHEIRNPLAIITGADSLIRLVEQKVAGGPAGNQQDLSHYLTILRGGVIALQNVMETSRHFDGDNLPVRKSEKLDALVGDAIAQSRHLFGGTKLKLDLDNAAGIAVSADRRMLVQVLVNIIRNACEAVAEKQPAEGGLITLACCTFDTSQVAVKITDNGIGMTDEVRDKLFGFKFTTKKDGTGVGLHLSKMLVKLHEGTITVDSKRGSGTTVSIYLPILKQ
jgi:signal transduction histidine kinase